MHLDRHTILRCLTGALVVVSCRLPSPRAADQDDAYARAGDSLIVMVSAQGRRADRAMHALREAGRNAAARERCAADSLRPAREDDPRLPDEAKQWVSAPRLVAVFACPLRRAVAGGPL